MEIKNRVITKLKAEFILFCRRTDIILFLIIVCGFLLRLINLTESLWLDELWSTRLKLTNLKSLAIVTISDVHPPFYSILMFLWTGLFGDSEISVRMPSLIFGVSSIFLIYVLTYQVFEKKVALLAAVLLNFSPVHIWYSHEARAYSALLFFLLLSIIAHLKLKDASAKTFWSFIYFSSMFACVLTHYYLTAYILLISTISIVGRHPRRRLMISMNAVILLCLFGWLMTKALLTTIQTGQADWQIFTFLAWWKLYFNWFLLGNAWDVEQFYWGVRVIQVFFAAIFAYGLISLWRNSDSLQNSHEIVFYLFILPVSLLLLGILGFNIYIERSAFVSLPFFLIVLARGITKFETKTVRFICILIVILFNILNTAIFLNRQDVWTVYKPKPNWRDAAHYIENQTNYISPKPEIFAVTQADELTYYNPRFKQISNPNFDSLQTIGTEQSQHRNADENSLIIYRIRINHAAKLYNKLVQDKNQEFLLIHNLYWSGSFPEIFENLKNDQRFQYKGMETFKGLEIHRFAVALK